MVIYKNFRLLNSFYAYKQLIIKDIDRGGLLTYYNTREIKVITDKYFLW